MNTKKNRQLVLNIILFQLAWFLCIWQGSVAAIAVTLVVLVIHFKWIVIETAYRQEAMLILKVLLLGVVVELIQLNSGALVSSSSLIPPSHFDLPFVLPPIWLLLLWALFATTVSHSLVWLKERRIMSLVFGALFAPLSYFAGAKISPTLSLGDSVSQSLVIIAVCWAIVLPLIFYFFVENSPEEA